MDGEAVSKSQFKAKALEYFRRIETSGQSLVVTDHGRPTLEVRRYRGVERKPLDVLRASVVRYDNATDPVAEQEWEAAQ
jgi:predicted nicotinamide N-methyase